jgi:hypothetical protein
MHAFERNFSRCVKVRQTGARRTVKEASPAAAALRTASSAMRAAPSLSGDSMYGRKRETPSGAKPRQSPERSAATTVA